MLTTSLPAVSFVLVSWARNVSATNRFGGRFLPPNPWRTKSEKLTL